MALEGLYVPINAPWYPDLRSELLSFPPASMTIKWTPSASSDNS
jgi:phage terminase large subunit-like protein